MDTRKIELKATVTKVIHDARPTVRAIAELSVAWEGAPRMIPGEEPPAIFLTGGGMFEPVRLALPNASPEWLGRKVKVTITVEPA
jgi:hypothetical protein